MAVLYSSHSSPTYNTVARMQPVHSNGLIGSQPPTRHLTARQGGGNDRGERVL